MDNIISDNFPQKQCSGCGELLPVTLFSKDASRKDGLGSRCKTCRSAYNKAYGEAHREELRASNKAYRAMHKDEVAKSKKRWQQSENAIAYRKQHYQEHKEEAREQNRLYRATHKEEISKQKKQSYTRNRGDRLAYMKNYTKTYRERINERSRARYWKNREHHLKQMRLYRENHREELREKNRLYNETHKEQRNAYRKQNRSRILERTRLYYKIHRDRKVVYARQYRTQHYEHCLQYDRHRLQTEYGRIRDKAKYHKRRALKKSAEGTLTTQQIQVKLKAQKYQCYYCLIKFEQRDGRYIFHLEHTIPLSRTEAGPRHDVNFVVLSCPSCNLKKSNKLPHEWPEGGRLL